MKMKLKSKNLKESLENQDFKELKIILVDNSTSIEELEQMENITSYLIIVLDYESRKKLLENNIEHKISDEFLNKNDLTIVYDEIKHDIPNHVIKISNYLKTISD